jgi:hypothetical protein
LVLHVGGMSHLLITALIVIGLGGFAAADQISVTAARAEDARVVQLALDKWAASRQLDETRRADVGVVRVEVEAGGGDTTVVAELTATVSDGRNEMRSVIASSARVIVPAAELRAKGLPKVRHDALLAATQALQPKLAAQLGSATLVAKR